MKSNSILSKGMKCPYCGQLINTSLEKAQKTMTTAYCYFCDKIVQLPEYLIERPEEPVIRYLGYFTDWSYNGYGSYVAFKKNFVKCDIANLTDINNSYTQIDWYASPNGAETLASRNNNSPNKDEHHWHQFWTQGYLVRRKAKEVIDFVGEPIKCRTPEENHRIHEEKIKNV